MSCFGKGELHGGGRLKNCLGEVRGGGQVVWKSHQVVILERLKVCPGLQRLYICIQII